MGFGGQSRGEIQSAKTQGWDPAIIPAQFGKPAESIAAFDHPPELNPTDRDFVGKIPGGPPSPTIAEATDPVISPTRAEFNHPDFNRTERSHATRGANPFAGM